MADQGKWFKLWCSSLHDEALENLSLEDWARWARLGAYIKEHGKEGQIRFNPPYRALLNLFRVPDLASALVVLHEFPNCHVGERNSTVSLETNSPVSLEIQINNWLKFQGDYSSHRVRAFRDKKRHSETLQEEKRSRRDKKRQDTSSPTPSLKDETDKTVSGYRIPEKDKDPTGYLVMQYKIRKIGQDAYDDRPWDTHHWARAAAASHKLIEILGGINDAKRCLTEVSEQFDEKKLSWTLETVVKWAHEWKARKNDGLKHSQRFLDALSRQRKNQGLTHVGGQASNEPSLDGARNLPAVQVKAGTD